MLVLFAAVATPAPTPPDQKPKLAVIAHGPGIEGVDPLADAVGNVLLSKGYPVLSRAALLRFLGAGSQPDPLESPRKKLAAADKAYLDLDLEVADRTLREAETELGKLLSDPQSVPLLRTVLERRALVLLTAAKSDAALEKLNDLYILDPEYKPDPRLLAPQFQPAFTKVQQRVAGAHRGTVNVISQPAGADVYVDGRWQGTAPIPVEVRSGQHVLQVRLDGYAGYGAWIRVDPELKVDLPVKLEPLPAEMSKRALFRSLDSDVVPGGHARVAADLKAMTGAQALAVLVARSTADGPQLSAEVFGTDPDSPPARTPEVALAALGGKGELLANAIVELLEHPPAPEAPLPAFQQLVRAPPIERPYSVGLLLGAMTYYGKGWGQLAQGGAITNAGMAGLTFNWRGYQQGFAAIDLVARATAYTASGCLSGPSPCQVLTVSNGALEIGPAVELFSRHFFVSTEIGLGAINTLISLTNAPTQNNTISQAAFVVAGHASAQAGFIIRDRWRLSLLSHVAIGDSPYPYGAPPLAKDGSGSVSAINVGGYGLALSLAYRF